MVIYVFFGQKNTVLLWYNITIITTYRGTKSCKDNVQAAAAAVKVLKLILASELGWFKALIALRT